MFNREGPAVQANSQQMASLLPNLLMREKAPAGVIRRARSEVALKKHLDRGKVRARNDIKHLQAAMSGMSNTNPWMGHQRPVRSSSTTALEKPIGRKQPVIELSSLECKDEENCSSEWVLPFAGFSLNRKQDSSLPRPPSSPSQIPKNQKNQKLEPLVDRPQVESVKVSQGQKQKMSRASTGLDKKDAKMFGGNPYNTFPKSKHRRSLSLLHMEPIAAETSPTESQPTLYDGFKQRRGSRGSCEVALELNCPLETTMDAKSLFEQYAHKGSLDYENFGKVVVQIMKSTRQQLTGEGMKNKIELSWKEADRNGNGEVGFDEFAIWYSSWGFQQEMLLSPQKIRRGTLTRDFAKKYDIDIVDVDAVYTKFQQFDEDGSGFIEFPEFVRLLHKLLKIPKTAELPANRLNMFWKEIDADGSGSVCADEFLTWFIKYFDVKGNSDVSPIEHFYQSVRPIGRSM